MSSIPREALKTSASKPGVIGVPSSALEGLGAGDHLLRVGDVGRGDPVHHLGGRIAQHALGADVEDLDDALLVGGDAREVGAVEDGALQRPGFEQRLFRPLALGDVLHGQDQQLAVVARLELAGVQQHHPAADRREGVLQLEVVEDRARGDDVLEERPQVGDVPLAVAQLVDQPALGLAGRDVERLVEGAVGRPHPQRGVEDQQRLPHRVHDVLRVGLDGLQIRLGASPLGDVLHGQDQELAVVARLELAGVQQHHPPADRREGVLQLEVVEDRARGDDVLEEPPQVGDVPLAVAQLVDQPALGLAGRDVERLVEGAVGRPHPQVASRISSGSRTVSTMFWA